MAANMTVYDAVLKQDYGPAIAEQLNNATFLLSRLKRKGPESLVGREFEIPLHVGRNVGIAARGEYDDLPSAGHQSYTPMRFRPTMIAGRIEVSEMVMQATRNDKGAFVRALRSEIDGLVRDFRVEVNRQLFGDGTGLLASVTEGGTNVNTVTVDSVRYLAVGMKIDILTRSNGTAIASDRTITAINRTTKQITFDGAPVNVGTTEGIYRSGAYNKEITGLAKIVSDTGVLQGVDPAVYPEWASTVLDNGGTARSISEQLLQQAWDAVEDLGEAQPDVILTTYGVRRAYQNLLSSLKRFASPMELEGGYKALEYNGKPFMVDRDCQPGRIYLLALDRLGLYQYSDPDWLDRDGAILHRVTNKAVWEATYAWFVQLATDRRNAHARIDDIQEA